MTHTTVALECSCGSVKGTIQVVKGNFFHVHCLCRDCQNFAAQLKNEANILDQYGASELFQTYPAYMEITEGQENVACLQLFKKGLLRWYTSCCHMPVANTMRSPGVPFVGVSVKLMKFPDEKKKLQALGAVTLKAFGKDAIGTMPQDAHERFPVSFMPKILWFMLKGMIMRKSSPSPFFENKAPITNPKILSQAHKENIQGTR